jgi:membrane protein implicated in regulation of membrane protease activity
MEAYQVALILASVFGILEVTTGTLIFLCFCFGALAVAIVQFIAGGFEPGRDLSIFSILSLISILIARRFFRKPADQTPSGDDDINQY